MRPGDVLTDDEDSRSGWPEGLAAAGLEVPATEDEATGWDAVPWLGPGAYGDVNEVLGMFTATVRVLTRWKIKTSLNYFLLWHYLHILIK